jgi:hypothetical protein
MKIRNDKVNLFSSLLHPVWKLILAGPPFIYGWFAFIRDEFISPEIAEQLRLGGVFKLVNWYWWVIIGLSISLIFTAFQKSKSKSNVFSDAFEFILKDTEFSNANNERGCAFILIHNISSQKIECNLRAKTEKMNHFRKLAWSEKNPISNLEYGQAILGQDDLFRSDVVVAWEKEEHAVFCIFPIEENDRIILPGTYEIIISAIYTIDDVQKEKQERFSLVYKGGNNLKLLKAVNKKSVI